ncbi:MAG: hypothetical protein KIG88_12875 [Weeksellaceae bacterium]|nr:hypothetical protein [Weeksellaceae bacterium]
MINLAKNIDNKYITHNESINEHLMLFEKNDSGNKKDKPYTGYLKKSGTDQDFLIITDLEDLSRKLSYSKNTPSDCDYIFINLKKKEIYFIEFKASNQFSLNKVKKQLLSGRKWLDHFCFCSDIDESILQSFRTYNIWWEHDGRACRSIAPFYSEEENIIKVKGSILVVSKIRHYMKTFE